MAGLFHSQALKSIGRRRAPVPRSRPAFHTAFVLSSPSEILINHSLMKYKSRSVETFVRDGARSETYKRNISDLLHSPLEPQPKQRKSPRWRWTMLVKLSCLNSCILDHLRASEVISSSPRQLVPMVWRPLENLPCVVPPSKHMVAFRLTDHLSEKLACRRFLLLQISVAAF
ncbi:unnamed protein product [Soboliphyme baturini]|uniref:Uncharacterized protein n=1 Tax=Soboliphyme baturini TaxID=241478 RepID=A0A183IZW4_9BILA|nr:unnamed protein product [Soboliphyme baturini]